MSSLKMCVGVVNWGGHPGWSFFEKLISKIASNAPEVWDYVCLGNILNRWIDSANLSRLWNEHHCTFDYSKGFNIFTLMVLANWLASRPSSFQTIAE